MNAEQVVADTQPKSAILSEVLQDQSTGPARRRHAENEGKLFLGGLEPGTTSEAILEYCQRWGAVLDDKLMEGRGFAFVTFVDPACAAAFLEQNQHEINGKAIEAKAAVPKTSGNGLVPANRKMFVGGTGELTDEEFTEYFKQYGDVEDSVILRKLDGSSRGFGFVTFVHELSVEKCLVMQHSINGKHVELKRAIRKEDMRPGQSMTEAAALPRQQRVNHGGKPLDWQCPECHNKNYGWRTECNRCKLPKPFVSRGAYVAFGQQGSGRGNGGPQYNPHAVNNMINGAMHSMAGLTMHQQPMMSMGYHNMQGYGDMSMAGYPMGEPYLAEPPYPVGALGYNMGVPVQGMSPMAPASPMHMPSAMSPMHMPAHMQIGVPPMHMGGWAMGQPAIVGMGYDNAIPQQGGYGRQLAGRGGANASNQRYRPY